MRGREMQDVELVDGSRNGQPAAFLGWSPRDQTSPPSDPSAPSADGSPHPLVVRCDNGGVHVDATDVRATAAGVPLLVSSTAPGGTYLNLAWQGGGQGDPAPTAPTMWTTSAPPGELQISCSNLDLPNAKWPSATVAVHDDGHWSDQTLPDHHCRGNSEASWAALVPPASQGAPSAEAALDGLIPSSTFAATSPSCTPAIGYPQADNQTWIVTNQTWIVTNAGKPYIAAYVTRSDDTYSATPGPFCA